MQQYGPSRKTVAEELSQKEFYKNKRIVKECKYFRTRKGAEAFAEKVRLENSGSYCGTPWADPRTMSWAIWKYRKY